MRKPPDGLKEMGLMTGDAQQEPGREKTVKLRS